MEPWQVLIAHAVKILVLLTLAGILARGRWRQCWWFTAYLMVILICNSLVSFWPEIFYQRRFWLARAPLYDGLKLAIAIEIAYRTFRAFPGAQATARRVLFAVLVATSLVLVAFPWDWSDENMIFEWEPRVLTGTIWFLNALAVIVIWYRVPIHALHKAILLGFVPYLVVFTIVLRLLRFSDWDIVPLIRTADPAAYMLLMGWWAWAAWQPEVAADVSPEVLRILQPERVRS
jgi:hypothetical protein